MLHHLVEEVWLYSIQHIKEILSRRALTLGEDIGEVFDDLNWCLEDCSMAGNLEECIYKRQLAYKFHYYLNRDLLSEIKEELEE